MAGTWRFWRGLRVSLAPGDTVVPDVEGRGHRHPSGRTHHEHHGYSTPRVAEREPRPPVQITCTHGARYRHDRTTPAFHARSAPRRRSGPGFAARRRPERRAGNPP